MKQQFDRVSDCSNSNLKDFCDAGWTFKILSIRQQIDRVRSVTVKDLIDIGHLIIKQQLDRASDCSTVTVIHVVLNLKDFCDTGPLLKQII